MNKKDKMYYLLACLHAAGAGLTPQELCRVGEEVLGEPFSTEVLEEKIEEVRREVPREDRDEWVKLLRKIRLMWQDMR